MRSFIGKLLSSTLLWSCLIFNFMQFVILENLLILDLAPLGVKEINNDCPLITFKNHILNYGLMPQSW